MNDQRAVLFHYQGSLVTDGSMPHVAYRAVVVLVEANCIGMNRRLVEVHFVS